jgi:hypothetical protein
MNRKILLTAVLTAILLVGSACKNPFLADVKLTPANGGDTTPPAEVTGLSAVAGHQQVTLSWAAPADSDFAKVEITHNQSGGGTAKAVNKGTNSYTWTSLTNGTEYTFTVKTVDSTGNKSAGKTKTATPATVAERVAAALAGKTGGTTGSPVDITITGAGSGNAANDIAALYDALEDAGGLDYVSLDLSGMTDIDEWVYVKNEVGTEKIVNITLPATVTKLTAVHDAGLGIDVGPFFTYPGYNDFSKLKSVSGAGVTDVGQKSFLECDALTSVSLPKAKSIGQMAFYQCDALTSVSLPKATDIGSEAFSYCTALESVDLPEATDIGEEAFYKCTALESVSLPKATSIVKQAFQYCTALTSVSLPAATTIGSSAFASTKYVDGGTAACKIYLGNSIDTWDDTNSSALYTAYQTKAAGWYYRTAGDATWKYKSTEPTDSDMGI